MIYNFILNHLIKHMSFSKFRNADDNLLKPKYFHIRIRVKNGRQNWDFDGYHTYSD
jgi:hypothetical protein